MTSAADVLVVGAGPTGLALALHAQAHGARVRIVERRATVFRPSRAQIVHPRTLEVLRPLGVTDALLARADTSPQVRLHLGRRVVPVDLGRLAIPDTAFPHLTLLRQMDVESVLRRALADRGVEVERGTELLDVPDCGDPRRDARVTLRSAAGVEHIICRFVAGCDGAGSTVRAVAGIGSRGGPYTHEVVLADIELDGGLVAGAAIAVAGPAGVLFIFPGGERATWRLLATRPAGDDRRPAGVASPPIPPGELQQLLDDARFPVRLHDVAWSTGVRVEHRLADRYRRHRVFLAGDAAHTHSPAAAQGMNTGIQDAINLGWKLAYADSPADCDELLDSYQRERRPVARQVIALTHLVFWAEASTDPVASILRRRVVPLAAPVLPAVLGQRSLVAAGIRALGQLRVAYRDSPLSVEGALRPPPGSGRAGERLPDATVVFDGRQCRLHDLLAQPGVHVLLHRDAKHLTAPLGPRLRVLRLASTPGRGVVAVRPDGYIGYRAGAVNEEQLLRWLRMAGALR